MFRPGRAQVVTDLQAFGLTAVEAQIYTLLATEGRALTGYEAAKELGISRANAYAALRRLEQRGFVAKKAQETGAPYWALPFDTIAERSLRDMRERVERLDALLQPCGEPGGTWAGEGWNAFLPECAKVIQQSQESVTIGATAAAVRRLADPLDEAEARGVPLRFGCWDGCPPSGCGVCRSPVFLKPGACSAGSCVVIGDERSAVAMNRDGEHVSVVVTDFPPLVAGLLKLVQV